MNDKEINLKTLREEILRKHRKTISQYDEEVGVGTAEGPNEPLQVQPRREQEHEQELHTEPESEEDELAQIDARLKLASYFRALVEQPPFGEDTNSDPYAAQVQFELTQWVKARMKELVGVKPKTSEASLSQNNILLLNQMMEAIGPNGISALVVLVDKILTKKQESVELPQVDSYENFDVNEQSGGIFLAEPPQAKEPSVVAKPVPKNVPRIEKLDITGPKIRKAKVPSVKVSSINLQEEKSEVDSTQSPKGRGKYKRVKKSEDPIANGKKMVESKDGPVGTPASPVESVPDIAPMPMPRGRAMEAVMQAKANESLGHPQIIEATGGGVL